MKTANLFQVENTARKTTTIFQYTNSKVEDVWIVNMIIDYYDQENEAFLNETVLNYFGIFIVEPKKITIL